MLNEDKLLNTKFSTTLSIALQCKSSVKSFCHKKINFFFKYAFNHTQRLMVFDVLLHFSILGYFRKM